MILVDTDILVALKPERSITSPVTSTVEQPFEAAMPASPEDARKNAVMAGKNACSTAGGWMHTYGLRDAQEPSVRAKP
jgi:hypothetical protein